MSKINITTSISLELYNRAKLSGFSRSASAGAGRKWSEAMNLGLRIILKELPDYKNQVEHLQENIAKLQERLVWQANRIEELEAKQ